MNMHAMSVRQSILNNPEWAGVSPNTPFAIVTIEVVIWQGCMMRAQVRAMKIKIRVMRWEGHISTRHERTQNQWIRLPHEHKWVSLPLLKPLKGSEHPKLYGQAV